MRCGFFFSKPGFFFLEGEFDSEGGWPSPLGVFFQSWGSLSLQTNIELLRDSGWSVLLFPFFGSLGLWLIQFPGADFRFFPSSPGSESLSGGVRPWWSCLFDLCSPFPSARVDVTILGDSQSFCSLLPTQCRHHTFFGSPSSFPPRLVEGYRYFPSRLLLFFVISELPPIRRVFETIPQISPLP